jgi:hypothetical protein
VHREIHLSDPTKIAPEKMKHPAICGKEDAEGGGRVAQFRFSEKTEDLRP